MAMFSFLKKLVSNTFLSGLEHAVKETMNDAEHRAEEIIDHAEKRAHEFVHDFVKGALLFFLGMTGLVFALVGLGMYLSQNVAALSGGIGYILVGAILLILAGFARWMQQ